MKNIRFCENCKITKVNTSIPVMLFSSEYDKNIIENYWAGYMYGIQDTYWNDTNKCPFCKHTTQMLNISEEDVLDLFKCSKGNRNLLEAMIDLRQKDVIEYELKMSQFRNQIQHQESMKQNTASNSSNAIHCPTCNSTNVKKISVTSKLGGAMMLGLLSKTAKSQFKCNNCGYKW